MNICLWKKRGSQENASLWTAGYEQDDQRLKMNIVTGGDSKRGYDEGLSWGGKRLKFGERFSALGYKNREGL